MNYKTTTFGTTKTGKKASLYTFTNENGMQMQVSDYGATLVSLLVPDKDGQLIDVVLGYDNVTGYEEGTLFLGASVGRSANRIQGASFVINGTKWTLPANENANSLHSGPDFYSKRMWQVEAVSDQTILLCLDSPHFDQGYPGDVRIFAEYKLTDDNGISIRYYGTPSEDTVMNLTNHSYFNMNGHASGKVWSQFAMIDADAYTEVDGESIPTGTLIDVTNTVMDLREWKNLGEGLTAGKELFGNARGYDHNWALNGEGFRKVAGMKSLETGIQMDVYTDCPGIQLYTANYVENAVGKNGAVYDIQSAACFETQFFPNAINLPQFESPLCKAGETYEKTTIYKFVLV